MPRTDHHKEKQHGRRHMIETPSIQPEELEEKIRLRAYELYEQRRGEQGDAESDWYQAIFEVTQPEKQH